MPHFNNQDKQVEDYSGTDSRLEKGRGELLSGAGSELREDNMYEVLSNRRRRRVIGYLREANGVASVSDLAEKIAADENDMAVDQISSYDRKRVYVSLYQNHLPKMDDANIIEYDENRKKVELLETVNELKPFIDDTDHQGKYPMVTTISIGIAIITLLGSFQVGPFEVVSMAFWTLFGAAGLIEVAGLKYLERSRSRPTGVHDWLPLNWISTI